MDGRHLRVCVTRLENEKWYRDSQLKDMQIVREYLGKLMQDFPHETQQLFTFAYNYNTDLRKQCSAGSNGGNDCPNGSGSHENNTVECALRAPEDSSGHDETVGANDSSDEKVEADGAEGELDTVKNLKFIPDNPEAIRGSDTYAMDSCPSCLSVCDSKYKGAGMGVWTEKAITPGTTFGPYKFLQNQGCRKYLLKTEGSRLVYCDPSDNLLGIGFDRFSEESNQEEKWGQNKVGVILMKIRENIIGRPEYQDELKEIREEVLRKK